MRITLIFFVLIFCSCNNDPKHYRDDKDFVLVSEIISPNNEFKIIEYHYNIGALGYSRLFWALVPNNDIKVNLYEYCLPEGYKAKGWTNKSEAIIEKWEPYYYKSKEVDLKTGDIYKGIQIIIK